jgi:hypothetical protein
MNSMMEAIVSAALSKPPAVAMSSVYLASDVNALMPAQKWSNTTDDFHIIVRPAEQVTGTWVIVRTFHELPRDDRTAAVAMKLRALRDWLDSLPDVPSIPLDALDRVNLY